MTKEQRCDLVAAIAHEMNNKLREHFDQKPSPKSCIPPGSSTLKVVRRKLNPTKSWRDWKKYKLGQGWKMGKYNPRRKTHPNLIMSYASLPFEERVKDYTFWAACYAAHRILAELDCGKCEKKS